MLYETIRPLRKNKAVRLLNKFLYSPCYMLIVAGLMAVSNIFSLEFFVFYMYLGFAVCTVLFAPDCFPLMPMFCCGYMLFSARNNPAAHYGEHFLSSDGAKARFIGLIAVIAVLLVTRTVFELVKKKRYQLRMPKLTWGFLLLGAAYVAAGLLSEHYSPRTVIFGALQIVSLCITYYFFYYTVDWENRRGRDIAILLCAIGIGMIFEIAGMYCTPEVIEAIRSGTFIRTMLVSGWGVYNNVGGVAAIFIPAPFYLAAKHRGKLFWILLGFLFFASVIFTQSRGSILSGGTVLLLGILFMLIYSRGRARIFNLVSTACLLAACGVVLYVLKDKLDPSVFLSLKQVGLDGAGRINMYKYGWERFCESPAFGNGFYIGEDVLVQHGQDTLPDKAFLPPRYHNTFVQLLASGGVVALIAYLFHRVQTILLVVKKRTPFKVFLGLSVLSILIGSLLDCHFFNFGPGLIYGVLLVSIERTEA